MPCPPDAGFPASGSALAIDIGGTKLAAGLVDGQGRLTGRRSTPTPATDDPEVVFRALAGLFEGLPIEGAAVCGIGCGGPMGPGGDEVSTLHIPAFRRFPLRSRVAEVTGLETFVDNDAKALARGEGWVGAAAGRADFIAMVVSTGVGGGIFLDGRLLDGRAGNAGHIGHVVVVPGGRECFCGGRGCLEAETSGRAIAAASAVPRPRPGPR